MENIIIVLWVAQIVWTQSFDEQFQWNFCSSTFRVLLLSVLQFFFNTCLLWVMGK